MPAIFIYLLKVSIAISLFYLGYYFFLKKLTFYSLNRFYLLFSILFSVIFPFLSIPLFFSQPEGVYYQVLSIENSMASFSQIDKSDNALGGILLVIYWVIVALGGIKLLTSFLSLYRIHLKSSLQSWESYTFNNLSIDTAPFSFLTRIYLNFEKHTENELHTILRHEQVHTKGLHSVDILLVELWCIFFWFSPFSWRLKKAIKVNVEFIADREVVQHGITQDAYQNSLLHFALQSQNLPLANQFAFLSLKARINMMNKKQSSKGQLGKYILVIPAIISSLFVFGVSKAYEASESAETIVPAFVRQSKRVIIRDTTSTVKPKVEVWGLKVDSTSDVASDIKNAMVVIDGVPSKKGIDEVKAKISIDDIKSVSVVKGQRATSIFGDGAKEGAVVIVTKKKGQSDENEAQVISIKKNAHPAEDRDTEVVRSISIGKKEGGGEENTAPLYILDGKEVEASTVRAMDPNEIKSMTVLKGTSAEVKYGEKGANGVIEIKLK